MEAAFVRKQPKVTELSFVLDLYFSAESASCVVMLETVFVGQEHLVAHSTIFKAKQTKRTALIYMFKVSIRFELCTIGYLLWCNWNWFVGRRKCGFIGWCNRNGRWLSGGFARNRYISK